MVNTIHIIFHQFYKLHYIADVNQCVFWHGNPNVYNPEDINTITKTTFGELYNKTIDREKNIKDLGYNLVTIWEKDYKNKIKNNTTKN